MNAATIRDMLIANFETLADGTYISQRKPSEVLKHLRDKRLSSFQMPEGNYLAINRRNLPRILLAVSQQARIIIPIDKASDDSATKALVNQRVQRWRDRNGVKLLKVAHVKNGESAELAIARRGASVFQRTIDNFGARPVVAVGGGRTIRDMMAWIRPKNRSGITIMATNCVTRIPESEDIYDSSYLAMQLHSLYKGSRPRVIPMPPLPTAPIDIDTAAGWHSDLYRRNNTIRSVFEQSTNADIVFLGAGNYSEDSPTMTHLYHHVGVTKETLPSFPVGDINFCLFDGNGHDITLEAVKGSISALKDRISCFEDQPNSHPFLASLNMECMRKMASNPSKTVAIVAGGNDGAKAPALQALFRARVANALVTDNVTLGRIITMDEKLSS